MLEKVVKTSDDLKLAMKNDFSKIRVEGVLADKIKRTMLIPKATFAAASAAAGVAIYSLATAHEEIVYAPITGGASPIIRFGAGTGGVVVVVSLLGPATAVSLISIGIVLGGLSGIKMLREKYKIEESGKEFVILVKK